MNFSNHALRNLRAAKHKEIASRIIERREEGTLRYGTIQQIVQEAQEEYPFVSRTAIANQVRSIDKLNKRNQLLSTARVISPFDDNIVNKHATTTPEISPAANEDVTVDNAAADTAVAALLELNRSLGGRPKGSTNRARLELKEREKKAINQIAIRYAKEKEASKA